MPRSSRTRFVINAEGKPRELFSLLPAKDGSISIFIKNAPQAEEGRQRVMTRQKFSLHSSKNSKDGGRLFKLTEEYSDKSILTKSQYRTPGDDGVLGVVFTRLCPDLKNEFYISNIDEGDDVKVISQCDAAWNTLWYAVVAVHPRIDMRRLIPANCNIAEYYNDFTQIFVLSTFFPIVPIPQGDMNIPWTEQLMVEYFTEPVYIRSLPLAEIIRSVHMLLDLDREKLRHRIKNYVFPDGNRVDPSCYTEIDEALNMGPIPSVPPFGPTQI